MLFSNIAGNGFQILGGPRPTGGEGKWSGVVELVVEAGRCPNYVRLLSIDTRMQPAKPNRRLYGLSDGIFPTRFTVCHLVAMLRHFIRFLNL